MQPFFITATGTDIGKTLITTILCHQLTTEGKRAHACKPIMSGYEQGDVNSDAARILRSLNIAPTAKAISKITPWGYIDALPPHLAARRERRPVAYDALLTFCRTQAQKNADVLLVEGAGGILSPLNDTHTLLDLATELGWPLLLVAGSYLGAISHTLSAIATIRALGAKLQCVVVSESAQSPVTLKETEESIRAFAGGEIPIYTLPRLQPGEEMWRYAPPLIACLK